MEKYKLFCIHQLQGGSGCISWYTHTRWLGGHFSIWKVVQYAWPVLWLCWAFSCGTRILHVIERQWWRRRQGGFGEHWVLWWSTTVSGVWVAASSQLLTGWYTASLCRICAGKIGYMSWYAAWRDSTSGFSQGNCEVLICLIMKQMKSLWKFWWMCSGRSLTPGWTFVPFIILGRINIGSGVSLNLV